MPFDRHAKYYDHEPRFDELYEVPSKMRVPANHWVMISKAELLDKFALQLERNEKLYREYLSAPSESLWQMGLYWIEQFITGKDSPEFAVYDELFELIREGDAAKDDPERRQTINRNFLLRLEAQLKAHVAQIEKSDGKEYAVHRPRVSLMCDGGRAWSSR